MNSKLKAEINRLRKILAKQRRPMHRSRPAGAQLFKKIKAETAVVLDDVTREFFLFSNGSQGETWAAAVSDQTQPLEFLALERALEFWGRFSPYDQAVYDQWNVTRKKRDHRIQPKFIRHKLWFPLAEFNGGSTLLLYDADPTRHGRYGQIIVYQHDPDAIYYVAAGFVEFLKKSNDLLTEQADELLPVPSQTEHEVWDVCEHGDLPRFKRLVADGLPLDMRRSLFGDSHSLLEHAAIFGQLGIIRYLRGRGVPIGKGLIFAAESGDLDVVKYVLTQDVRLDEKQEYGETALMRAARFGHPDIVAVLLARGAKTTFKNDEGKTAADLAAENKHAGVAALLKRPAKKKG